MNSLCSLFRKQFLVEVRIISLSSVEDEWMEGEMKDYTKERILEIRDLLRKLLAADDVVRVLFLRGELSREEASRLGGGIAVAVDGIVLDALRVEALGRAIVPVLVDKVKNGTGETLPFTHLLQMLAFEHELEVAGRTPKADDVRKSVNIIRSTIGLEDVEERRDEFLEEAEEEIKQFQEDWSENPMFG